MRVELNQKRVELNQNELSKKELLNVAPASNRRMNLKLETLHWSEKTNELNKEQYPLPIFGKN